MSGGEHAAIGLSEEQRRLIRENLGLVGVHLRRNVADLRRRRCGRERDDLFQEGCLGLIRAALDFRPEKGIPFAAFALPRIHHAVSEALRKPLPERQAHRGYPLSHSHRRKDKNPQPDSPLGLSMASEEASERSRPDGATGRETIAQRMREKYERAVRKAAELAAGGYSRRGDREDLVSLLVEEHFLIPDEDSRRSMRQIARDTRSSCDRVSKCAQRMGKAIRTALGSDPEFRELRDLGRRAAAGYELFIDQDMDFHLAQTGAVEFIQRFRAGDHGVRGRMLQDLLGLSGAEVEALVHERFVSLPVKTREALLHGAPAQGM